MTRPEQSGPVERLVRHDQWIVATAATVIVLLAGIYTYAGVGMGMSAAEMTRMAGPIGKPMSMGPQPVWTVGYAVVMFFMWWIMMIAMMTPSAAPMLLLYSAIKRMGPEDDRVVAFSIVFLSGYLTVWGVFSIAAIGLQWSVETLGISDGPMMTIKSRGFAAALLIGAGIYQFTSLKESCLTLCRSPAQFLSEHQKPGLWGAFQTGARHGVFCVGCCWALMVLLFVGGVMNLFWIVGLALYVLAEKFAPNPRLFSRITGACLIIAGLGLLF
ncbi:DUF2182 domain-containing protein [Primorskyibacter sp. S87]|uniref:DUF2182 domain-containing protein n=1 Tax=Primorskyibacter sp. S87 TaxID=3415126 RepID=UPI003C7DC03D